MEGGGDTYLGLDGGGTKTLCLLADGRGRILGLGRGGAANTNFVPEAEARTSILDAVRGAWRMAGPPACPPRLAIVGGPVPDALAAEVTRQETGAVALTHAPEGEVAWHAALAFRHYACGLAVGAGTGAIAWGFDGQGHQAVASAWGSLLGDEGSGYWIGMEAMRAVARAEDGREPSTRLREALLQALHLQEPWDMVRLVYQRGMQRHEVAALCPLVARAAQGGDTRAQRILTQAGEELALAASAVVHRLHLEREQIGVVPFGGVFRAGEMVLAPFRQALARTAPLASLQPLCYEPVVGALLIALRRAEVPVDGDLLATLDASLARFDLGWHR